MYRYQAVTPFICLIPQVIIRLTPPIWFDLCGREGQGVLDDSPAVFSFKGLSVLHSCGKDLIYRNSSLFGKLRDLFNVHTGPTSPISGYRSLRPAKRLSEFVITRQAESVSSLVQ